MFVINNKDAAAGLMVKDLDVAAMEVGQWKEETSALMSVQKRLPLNPENFQHPLKSKFSRN